MRANVIVGMLFLVQCFSTVAQEQTRAGKTNWYVGLDAHYLLSDMGNDTTGVAEFKLNGAGLRVGTYVQKQVGIELYGLFGVGDDQDVGIDLKLPSSVGLLGRVETPETEGGKLFILLGYGASELELQRSAASLPDRELYHGFVYGGGVEFRLGESNSFLNLQGLKYYDEGDISLTGLNLGLRYQF